MDKIERMRRFLENNYIAYQAGKVTREELLLYSALMDRLISQYYLKKKSCPVEKRQTLRGRRNRLRKRA